jgi:hypothetical protein
LVPAKEVEGGLFINNSAKILVVVAETPPETSK